MLLYNTPAIGWPPAKTTWAFTGWPCCGEIDRRTAASVRVRFCGGAEVDRALAVIDGSRNTRRAIGPIARNRGYSGAIGVKAEGVRIREIEQIADVGIRGVAERQVGRIHIGDARGIGEREKVKLWLVPAWLEKGDVGAASVTERDCASKGRPAPNASTIAANPKNVLM